MSPSRDDAPTSTKTPLVNDNMNPNPATLPPSVEEAYKRKCISLKGRMREVEEANDQYRLRRERLARGIRKMRLERAILLETLAKRVSKKGPSILEGAPEAANGTADGTGTNGNVNGIAYEDDTEDSTDSPPTPQERPMRIKRPHRRNDPFIHEGTPGRGGTDNGDLNAGDDYDEALNNDDDSAGGPPVRGSGASASGNAGAAYSTPYHDSNGREEMGPGESVFQIERPHAAGFGQGQGRVQARYEVEERARNVVEVDGDEDETMMD